jgi:hypothetical protein
MGIKRYKAEQIVTLLCQIEMAEESKGMYRTGGASTFIDRSVITLSHGALVAFLTALLPVMAARTEPYPCEAQTEPASRIPSEPMVLPTNALTDRKRACWIAVGLVTRARQGRGRVCSREQTQIHQGSAGFLRATWVEFCCAAGSEKMRVALSCSARSC